MKAFVLAVLILLASSAAAAPNPSFTARKIQGSTCLAPCAVHFDAIGMGALSASPYVTTETTDSVFNREFHSLLYEWDFDDPNSGTWSTGAAAATGTPQSKNYDIGAIAGHLYENPGTYTVTLTVTNPAGESAQTTRQVVVGDRTTYFSAADTFCFANDDLDWTGCPLDCVGGDDNCTVTADLDLALEGGDNCVGGVDDCAAFTTQQRRVLFRRGDTFVSNATIDTNPGATPGFVEAFGSGAKPIFDLGGSFFESGVSWTFIELDYRNCNTSCITGTVNDFRATYVGVSATYDASCYQNNNNLPWPPETFDEWPYLWALIDVDCTGDTAGQSSYGSWPTANYLLWMGGTHNHAPTGGGNASTVRAMHLQHSVFAHRSWLNPTPTREHWELRNHDVVGTAICGTADECSGAFNILQDNFLEESASNIGWTVRVCVDAGCNCGEPTGCGTDPNGNGDGTIVDVHDFIFERNFHHWPQDSAASRNGIYELQGGSMTIRNNVYDLQGGFTGGLMLAMVTGEPTAKLAGSTTTGNVQVYNNTLYFDQSISSNLTVGGLRGTGTGCGTPTPVGCIARNNLVVGPNFTGSLAWDSAFTHSDDLKVTTPNPFVATVPARGTTAIDDFALAAASAPIDAGYNFVPGTDTDRWVYDDAMRLCRSDGQWDVGAHEFGASACDFGVEPLVHRLGGGRFGGARW